MQLNQIQKTLKSYKPGSFIKVCWEKDISSTKAKNLGILIIKKCEGVLRTCINYKNVKRSPLYKDDNINNDVNSSSKKKSWFEHSQIRGVVQSKSNADKKYLQLYPVKGQKIKTQIIIEFDTKCENEKIKLENLYELGLIKKSDLVVREEEPIVMTLDINNITKFGK